MFKEIFNIKSAQEFDQLAMQIFKHQFENNPVYRSFCDLLYVHPSDVKELAQIPFLPIQFFKSHQILSTSDDIQETFTSSGTTGSITSKHLVTDRSLYEQSYSRGFHHFYGNIEEMKTIEKD